MYIYICVLITRHICMCIHTCGLYTYIDYIYMCVYTYMYLHTHTYTHTAPFHHLFYIYTHICNIPQLYYVQVNMCVYIYMDRFICI